MPHTFELRTTKAGKKPGVLSYIGLNHFREHEDGEIQISFDCFSAADMDNEIDRLIEELKEFKAKTKKLYAR